MIAWDWLLLKSIAPDESTAWVHLQNQAGNLISDGYEVDLEMNVTAQIIDTDISISIDPPINVTIDTTSISVEID